MTTGLPDYPRKEPTPEATFFCTKRNQILIYSTVHFTTKVFRVQRSQHLVLFRTVWQHWMTNQRQQRCCPYGKLGNYSTRERERWELPICKPELNNTLISGCKTKLCQKSGFFFTHVGVAMHSSLRKKGLGYSFSYLSLSLSLSPLPPLIRQDVED